MKKGIDVIRALWKDPDRQFCPGILQYDRPGLIELLDSPYWGSASDAWSREVPYGHSPLQDWLASDDGEEFRKFHEAFQQAIQSYFQARARRRKDDIEIEERTFIPTKTDIVID